MSAIVAFFASLKALSTWASLAKSIWGAAVALFKFISQLVISAEQKKESDGMKQGEDQLKDSNKIEDENERLRKKAEAACKIEQGLDPDSNCSQ